jgi:lipopolysaccharide export system permease protein
VETVGLNLARQDASLWFMSYLSSVFGIIIVWCLLFASTKPYLFKQRPRIGAQP